MLFLIAQSSFTGRALAVSFIASLSLLIGAHLFERIGGLAPCILCLDQREAHWAALGVATAGLISAWVFRSKLAAGAAVGALALVYLVSAGLAFYHTGVEYAFWPGPALCASTGANNFDFEDLGPSLLLSNHAPACDEVQWRFLGVSMAGYNLLVSAGLFALTMTAAIAETRSAHQERNFTRPFSRQHD